MKKYISTYLPGDVMLGRDGSIGLITKVHIRTSTGRHLSWNYRWQRDSAEHIGDILDESYGVDVIPGYPCGKLSWWHLDEIKQVMKGPLHMVLSGVDPRTQELDSPPMLLGDTEAPALLPDSEDKTLAVNSSREITDKTPVKNRGNDWPGGTGGLSSVAPFGRPNPGDYRNRQS